MTTSRAAVAALTALVILAAPAGCSSSESDASGASNDAAARPAPTSGTSPARSGDGPVRSWDGVAYPVWSADAYGGAEVRQGLADIAATGARAVSIIPTWYVTDTSTSLPHRDPDQTATDETVRAAIAEAHHQGLRVILKPHVDVEDDTDRAGIVPADPAAWFGRYQEMMSGYARLAAETGVEMLCVGTELAGTMTSANDWTVVIGAARVLYDGPLTYAANFDSYTDVPFWDQLDDLGIDAYFELATTPTTDTAVLVEAWRPILADLERFAAGFGKQVLFTEAGFVSQTGSTTEPWNWEISDDRADAEQAAGYRALFEAVAGRPWFAGVQWWMWDDLADTGEDQSLDYTPHGKPAEQVLRAEWPRGSHSEVAPVSPTTDTTIDQ